MVLPMQPIDDATSAFLHSAGDDLQRQLGLAAALDKLTVDKMPNGVTRVAALRIGDSSVAIRGSGANLIAAYADLRLAIPEPVLVAAFTQVMES
jgi:hypothetical protein